MGPFKFIADEIQPLRAFDFSYEYNTTPVTVRHGPIRPEDQLGGGVFNGMMPFALSYVKLDADPDSNIPEAIEGTSVVYGLLAELGDAESNPTIHTPARFGGVQPGGRAFLDWVGSVWLQWTVDETGITSVDVTGPNQPKLIPYNPDIALGEGQSYGYYIFIGASHAVADLDKREDPPVPHASGGAYNEWLGHFFTVSGATLNGTGGGSGVDGELHPWKVTEASFPVTAHSIATQDAVVDVVGGEIFTQGNFHPAPWPVPGVTRLVVNEFPYVVRKTTRSLTTRAIDSAVIEALTVIPASDYYTQYVKLAEVYTSSQQVEVFDVDGNSMGPATRWVVESITQFKFEEDAIFEDLAVIDGEFALVPLEMSGQNTYTVPP